MKKQNIPYTISFNYCANLTITDNCKLKDMTRILKENSKKILFVLIQNNTKRSSNLTNFNLKVSKLINECQDIYSLNNIHNILKCLLLLKTKGDKNLSLKNYYYFLYGENKTGFVYFMEDFVGAFYADKYTDMYKKKWTFTCDKTRTSPIEDVILMNPKSNKRISYFQVKTLKNFGTKQMKSIVNSYSKCEFSNLTIVTVEKIGENVKKNIHIPKGMKFITFYDIFDELIKDVNNEIYENTFKLLEKYISNIDITYEDY